MTLQPLDFQLNPFEILHVSRDATVNDVQRAWKHQAKMWHPDRNASTVATQRMAEINRSREILTDPQLRTEWEQWQTDSSQPPTSTEIDHDFSPRDDRVVNPDITRRHWAVDGVLMLLEMLWDGWSVVVDTLFFHRLFRHAPRVIRAAFVGLLTYTVVSAVWSSTSRSTLIVWSAITLGIWILRVIF